MRLAVLGFAGAAPLLGACSGYAVSDEESTILLDCGPGTLERAWRLGLVEQLDAIVISHMHADHILDLVMFAGEAVRAQFARRPKLFLPAETGRRALRDLDRAFLPSPEADTRFDVAFEIVEYHATDGLEIGRLELTFAPTAHTAPCFAIRVAAGDLSLVYGADGGPSSEVERLAAGTDLLILEATFADDAEAAAAHGHMTARQAGELAARADAKLLLLTHLLPGAGEELVALGKSSFAGRVDLARERLIYDLGP